MSKSRNNIAQELELREEDIKCKNCLEARDYNKGTYYCSEWHGRIDENDFCSYFELNEKRKL